jgi:hypothetical protein
LIKLYRYFISDTPVIALLILASASVKKPSGEQTTAQGGDLIAIVNLGCRLSLKFEYNVYDLIMKQESFSGFFVLLTV